MAKPMSLYPPDHNLALSRVLRVVDIIAAEPTIEDDAVVARLARARCRFRCSRN